jgi:hypothetical protein
MYEVMLIGEWGYTLQSVSDLHMISKYEELLSSTISGGLDCPASLRHFLECAACFKFNESDRSSTFVATFSGQQLNHVLQYLGLETSGKHFG